MSNCLHGKQFYCQECYDALPQERKDAMEGIMAKIDNALVESGFEEVK